MTDFYRVYGLWLALSLVMGSLSSCNGKAVSQTRVTAALAQDPGFPTSIRITIASASAQPLCIATSEISNGYENLRVRQNGKQVFSQAFSNRAVKTYKGINALDPIHIILQGNTEFWYELEDFPLRKGAFSVTASFRMIACSELFGPGEPVWLTVPTQRIFNYDPDDV
jgi:hypothetical protein